MVMEEPLDSAGYNGHVYRSSRADIVLLVMTDIQWFSDARNSWGQIQDSLADSDHACSSFTIYIVHIPNVP